MSKVFFEIGNLIQRSRNSVILKDILIIAVLSAILFILVFSLDIFHYFQNNLSDYSKSLNTVFLIFSVFLSVSLITFSYRRYNEAKIAHLGRLKAESQREKSKDQLQSVLDAVPDFILQLDLQLRVIWANKTALSYAPDLIGNFAYEYFNYKKGSFIDAYVNWAIDSRKIETGIQYQASLRKYKEATYWELTGVPLNDKSGNVYGAIAIARDITSRMRLENTWNLLSSVVESTDDAIYGITLNGTVISWNRGAENMYEYSQNEIIGGNINKIIPPLDRKDLYSVVEKVMRTEKLERFETIRIKKDESKIVVSTTICPFVDATGKKIGVSAIERDITESKKAQEKLLESENFNKTIISSVKEGIVVYNSKLTISSWNKSMETITGIKEIEVINRRNLNIFPNNMQSDMLDRLDDALKGKTVIFQDVYLKTPALPDGAWFNVTFSPHINKNLDTIGVIATYRDITQSKIAEVALAYSEEKYRQLVENVSEAIANIGVDGTILFVNEVAADLLKQKSEKVIGKSVLDVIPAELRNNLKNGLDEFFKTPDKKTFDFTVDLPGVNKSFLISAQPVFSSHSEITSLMCLITDITFRKKAEKELQHSQEQLRNLAAHLESVREDERKEIAFEVHDELGQELTALKLDLSWIEGKLTDLQPVLKEKISEMKDLIDTTIDRVGNISTKLRPDILDHFGLVAAIEWATGDFQKRSGIRCELIFDPEEIKVDGDIATVIFRILQETLTNVIRHSKADTVEVLFSEKKDKYELKVSDNGVGIKKERIEAPESFGLFAINERARSVGGYVDIHGKEGKGTKIKLIIPKSKEQ